MLLAMLLLTGANLRSLKTLLYTKITLWDPIFISALSSLGVGGGSGGEVPWLGVGVGGLTAKKIC